MISYDQMKKYRASWADVARELTELGGFTTAEVEEERLRILRQVSGKTSSKDLNNQELNKVLKAHRKHCILIKGPTDPTDDPDIKNLIFRIEKHGIPDYYLAKICFDQHDTREWRKLPLADLEKFSFTAASKAKYFRAPKK